jgi:hypothetical protein
MAQGEILALTVVMLIANRLWLFLPAMAPGLWLAHSRGAWAALALGLIATRFRRPLWLLAGALALGIVYSVSPSPSDLQRLQIWRGAYRYLTFWGNGFDTFQYLWIGNPVWHPEYAHNDYLQTVFEFGVWSIIPFSVLAFAVSLRTARDWPVLIAFLFMACFSMPVHMPMTLILGGFALATILMGPFNA